MRMLKKKKRKKEWVNDFTRQLCIHLFTRWCLRSLVKSNSFLYALFQTDGLDLNYLDMWNLLVLHFTQSKRCQRWLNDLILVSRCHRWKYQQYTNLKQHKSSTSSSCSLTVEIQLEKLISMGEILDGALNGDENPAGKEGNRLIYFYLLILVQRSFKNNVNTKLHVDQWRMCFSLQLGHLCYWGLSINLSFLESLVNAAWLDWVQKGQYNFIYYYYSLKPVPLSLCCKVHSLAAFD